MYMMPEFGVIIALKPTKDGDKSSGVNDAC